MEAEIETIPLLITPGVVGSGSLDLRFPPEYADEVKALLDENGVEHSTAAEFSSNVELAIEAVVVIGAGSVAGIVTALTSAYKTFVHRHDGKRVVTRVGDREYEAAGFSKKDAEQIIRTQIDAQAKRDADWFRSIGDQEPDR